MKNRLVFPDGTPYNPTQRAKIMDVWAEPSIGLARHLGRRKDFPDLVVNPVYSGGKVLGRDTRYVAFVPSERGDNYSLELTDSGRVEFKSNPKIKTDEISLERGKYVLQPGKGFAQRVALVTRVTPKNGAMTYNAIIDVPIRAMAPIDLGIFWLSEEAKKKEEESNKRNRDMAWTFF